MFGGANEFLPDLPINVWEQTFPMGGSELGVCVWGGGELRVFWVLTPTQGQTWAHPVGSNGAQNRWR